MEIIIHILKTRVCGRKRENAQNKLQVLFRGCWKIGPPSIFCSRVIIALNNKREKRMRYLNCICDIPSCLPFRDLVLMGRVVGVNLFTFSSFALGESFQLVSRRFQAVWCQFGGDKVFCLEENCRHLPRI